MTQGHDLPLTINVTERHAGACPKIYAHGPGAEELHAALTEILGRYSTPRPVLTEIEHLFDPPPPPKKNDLANLWVTKQYRSRNGQAQRVTVAIGPAANELRDVLVAVVRNRVASYEAVNAVVGEINDIFEVS